MASGRRQADVRDSIGSQEDTRMVSQLSSPFESSTA